MLRRGSGEHGELGSVIDVLDCVQERRRGTAGGAQAQVHFGLVLIRSFCCELNEARGQGRRRVEVQGIEEMEGALAYRRRRIGPEKSTCVRHSDERLR
jgi:hypothetical protein